MISILIREDCRDLTTFVTPIGQFRYKRLPFGLANAPSIFTKAMRQLLANCKGVDYYLDDVLVSGKDKTEHDQNLAALKKVLAKNKVTLNDQKCVFAASEIDFLGRSISAGTISPPKRPLEAIVELKIPTTKSELRSFLGFASFYRTFVPNFADLTTDLYALTKEGITFSPDDSFIVKVKHVKDMLLQFVPLA